MLLASGFFSLGCTGTAGIGSSTDAGGTDSGLGNPDAGNVDAGSGDIYLPWEGGPSYYSNWSAGPSANANYFPIAVWLQSASNAPAYRAIGINTYIGLSQDTSNSELAALMGRGHSDHLRPRPGLDVSSR